MPPQRRNASEDHPDLTIKVDGVPYPLRVQEVSGSIVARLRRESGLSWVEVMSTLSGRKQGDLDTVAATMCVSEWQRGLKVRTYDQVADTITYGSSIVVDYGEEDAPTDVPASEDPNV